uniref:NLE domain-containing protein n=1 Tax=Timema bartmani TaxID=61472 RepID=A0A7R9EP39_9NEOP|nr:unnamed protein product [Timema bartmani]
MGEDDSRVHTVLGRLVSETGEVPEGGGLLDLPTDITTQKLQLILNTLLQKDLAAPDRFFVNDCEITTSLEDVLKQENISTEKLIDIVYREEAVFRVRAVTRCTSSLPGHSEAVISVSFSPDGQHLASGSGDTTVRFWDIHTQTPQHVGTGHKHWVLCIAWSPDGKRLASGCKNGRVLIWDPNTGQQVGRELMGHKQWITALSWEPYHSNPECRKLASASKDGDVKIWDVVLGQASITLAGHTKSVTSVKWGGTGLIYTGSQDRTIKVWRAADGVLCRTLDGHAHWVNTLALSTDYVLRTGPFNPVKLGATHKSIDKATLQQLAKERYDEACKKGTERLVSGSDDFTMFLWMPEVNKKLIARMTGHQQLVNDVKFSPDTHIIASASFDKSVKLWDGLTGKFIASLRGHVQAVYQVAWSADSRLLVSGSSDSTLKVWSTKTKKLEIDLPGHADEVYAVDWSPDGARVASGGKDKVLRL